MNNNIIKEYVNLCRCRYSLDLSFAFSWAEELFSAAIQQEYFLERKSNNAFAWRDGDYLFSLGNNLYNVFGWNTAQFAPFAETNEMYRSADSGATWIQLDNAPIARRHNGGYAVKNEVAYFWGGTGEQLALTDSATFDEENGWQVLTTDMGSVFGIRQLFAWGFDGTYFYAAGGQSNFNGDILYRDVIRSLDCITWEKMGDLPEAIAYCSAGNLFFLNGKMFYLSGGRYNPSNEFNAGIYSSTDSGATWVYEGDLPSIMRSLWANVEVVNGVAFFLNGYDVINKPGLYYSTDGITWINTVSGLGLPVAPGRHAAGICNHKNKLTFGMGNDTADFWVAHLITTGMTPSFNPPDLDNVWFWFKGYNGLAIDDDKIMCLVDQSENGNHARQDTIIKRPSYNATGINGLPSIEFNGSNNYMSLGNQTTSNNYTIFSIFKTSDIDKFQIILGSINGGAQSKTSWATQGISQTNPKGSIYYSFGDNSDTLAWSDGNTDAIIENDVWCVLTTRHREGEDFEDVFLNGINVGIVKTTQNAINPADGLSQEYSIGVWGAYNINFFLEGAIAETLAYKSALSDDDIIELANNYKLLFDL